MNHNHERTSHPGMARTLRASIAAALCIVPLALCSTAYGRPEPIKPPPGGQPGAGQSPATGQPAPADPGNPAPIPPPQGLACIAGGDQSVCDPGHPGTTEGKRPGNTPPPEWFNDMAGRMFNLQQSLGDLADFGSSHDPYIHYYSTWLMSVTQEYYALGFTSHGSPQSYSFGPMTRGDFNQVFYYWLRPIYFSLLHYAAEYYGAHGHDTGIGDYTDLISGVVSSYHPLVLCNYGFNGNDTGAREDMGAEARELEAGARR